MCAWCCRCCCCCFPFFYYYCVSVWFAFFPHIFCKHQPVTQIKYGLSETNIENICTLNMRIHLFTFRFHCIVGNNKYLGELDAWTFNLMIVCVCVYQFKFFGRRYDESSYSYQSHTVSYWHFSFLFPSHGSLSLCSQVLQYLFILYSISQVKRTIIKRQQSIFMISFGIELLYWNCYLFMIFIFYFDSKGNGNMNDFSDHKLTNHSQWHAFDGLKDQEQRKKKYWKIMNHSKESNPNESKLKAREIQKKNARNLHLKWTKPLQRFLLLLLEQI